MAQRILIVDDEPSIRYLLQRALEDHYHVETASTAFEALDKLRVISFDLAIVDLLLPGINGLDLAEAIRVLDPGTPVILITAYGTTSFENMATHPAISIYLQKPLSLDRLLKLVGQLCSDPSRRN
ncbi:MAG: response regulator [Anaerolineae bacterium]